jgi:hypothetical protein
MKTKINHLFLFALFTLLSFTACQNEATEIDNPSNQETIVANSSLSGLMSRTTANFGATDDILDGASCFSVELPVTIIVSDITIVIETEADLEQLEDLFEDFIDDDDFLDFVFPITIIFSDYTELVIENEDQLEDFINDCDVDVDDDAIECVDFVYPISFSVFNSEFNLLDTVVLENDEALYEFLEDLEDEENAVIVSLNYPVTLEYANGETIEVTNNLELAEAIEAAGEDCDDEDDECLEEEVAVNLVECPWEVYLYSNNDLENLDGPYIFNFTEDGVLTIAGITTEIHTTTWELSETDEGLELNIASFYYFEAQFGNWLVVECDDDDLEFIHQTVEGTGLYIEQDCEDDLDCSLNDISSILQECPWDFTDGTDTYNNYQMVFNQNGDLLIPEEIATSAIGGSWNLSLSNDGLPEIVISNLTAFADDLEGSWIVVECDEDGELTIIRGDSVLELDQDCEGDLSCSSEDISYNLIECAWMLQTNLIDFIVPVYFTPNGQVLSNNDDIPESQMGTWEIVTVASDIYIEFTLQQGFDVLNGQWQVVECDEGALYLINGNNYMALEQDCDLGNDNDLFNCFGDFELVECAGPNNIPEYNLSAGTIGLVDCTESFIPSFHVTLIDAENNTNAIVNTEAYETLVAQVYLRIEAESGNFQVFTIYLNIEECNLFECFASFDAVIVLCDEGNDGVEIFDVTIAFANCTPTADLVAYYEIQADAEAGTNPISNPGTYTNNAEEQTIFVRVEINNQFEVFPILLILEDCNQQTCSEADVDAFLAECIWNAVNYNGSDNLIEYNFDFESNSQTVVIYTNEITIDATWSTSQSSDGVIIEFSNVAGSNIQAITGEWLVVECETGRLELHRGDDILVLERNCD